MVGQACIHAPVQLSLSDTQLSCCLLDANQAPLTLRAHQLAS
jgi:hypothetical protein